MSVKSNSSNVLRLITPSQEVASVDLLKPSPKELKSWMEALHLANVEETTTKLHELLYLYNRRQIEPAIRYQVMEMVHDLIQQQVKLLKDRFAGNAYPLSDRYRKQAKTVQDLLSETASGYKNIVIDLVGPDKNYKLPKDVLLRCVCRSIDLLSHLLLVHYLVYQVDPRGVWGELHRLYYFSEHVGIHEKILKKPEKEGEQGVSIANAYKQAVLLALVDPSHLMQDEAATIFNKLNKWIVHCKILSKKDSLNITGNFFVDLSSEMQPRFAANNLKINPVEVRLFDVKKLVNVITYFVAKLSEKAKDESNISTMTLKNRMYRNMLQRIKYAWGGNVERKEVRLKNEMQVLMTVGLSACHFFTSGEKSFSPEADEVRCYNPKLEERQEKEEGGAERISSGLTLAPADYQPWKLEEKAGKLEADVGMTRVSRFEGEAMWEKVYATHTRARALQQTVESSYTVNIWRQVNESIGGIGIVRDKLTSTRVRVGDLVAFKFGDAAADAWHIGAIRWLTDSGADALQLGLMTMAHQSKAVAVRALSGAGKGSEYFRSIIVYKKTDAPENESLILPSSIYDLGTKLVLNLQDEIKYIRLSRLVDTTNAYSQFAFDYVSAPASEMKKIKQLRGT